MLITILTGPTRGDVQLYIALGMELKKSGYDVRIVAFENYEAFVKSFGLDFYPIKHDISAIATGDSVNHARSADNPLKVILSFNKLKSLVYEVQEETFNACDGSDAIIYHPGSAIAYFIARHFNIKSILATPFPMTPTRDYPALIFYNFPRFGKAFNLMTHKIFEKILWSSGGAIKQFWKAKFGSLPDDFNCPFRKQYTRTSPTLVAVSNFVFPKPSDWPEHVYNTGYWFLDSLDDWKPSDELIDFIDSGSAPVYVGFGSLGDPATAAQATELVVSALKRSGQRGILATGWQGMSKTDNAGNDIFILESASHSWLFPKMAAVIHHGGAGTTAAGLRAGVPGIAIPHSNDQFAWGRRIYELGVGPKPIPRKKLTTENLSDAINFALKQDIKDAAKALGLKIQDENGVKTAVEIVNNCFE